MMLSPPEPQMMLSPGSTDPQMMFSQSRPPQAEPQTMLLPQMMLSFAEPQMMLSFDEPQMMLSFDEPQMMLSFDEPQMMLSQSRVGQPLPQMMLSPPEPQMMLAPQADPHGCRTPPLTRRLPQMMCRDQPPPMA